MFSHKSVLGDTEFSAIILENKTSYENDLLTFNQRLKADYLFLGVKKGQTIQVLLGIEGNQCVPMKDYDLAGSPCERVIQNSACGYEADICRYFPNDNTLAALDAEAYLGAGIFNENNENIGILAAVFVRPKSDIDDWLYVFSLQAKLFSMQLQKDFFSSKTAHNLALVEEISRMAQTGSWEYYPQLDKLFWSREVYRIHKVRHGSRISIDDWFTFFTPSFRGIVEQHFETLVNEGKPYDLECQIQDADGTARWVRASGKLELSENGQVRRLFGALEDVTEYKSSVLLNEERARKIHSILNSINDAVFSIDEKGTITHCNDVALNMFGYTYEELVTSSVELLMPEPYASNHATYMRNYFETGKGKIIGIGRQLPAKRKNGEIFQMELSLSESSDAGEKGFIGVIRDISERLEAQDTIYNLAYTDPVTHLRNQKWFHKQLNDLILRASLNDEFLHILLLDIDNMSQMNTRFGFRNGDYALKVIAEKLLFVIGHDYEIFKYGGDSFVVLSRSTYKKNNIHHFDTSLIENALLNPRHFDVIVDSTNWSLTASLGSAIVNPKVQSFEVIISVIEQAVKRAKRSAPFGLCHISDDGYQELDRYLEVKSKLKHAIEKDELSVVLQPQVTREGEISSFEALVRWHSNTLGWVSPTEFIPIAEESYAICEIGDIVLRKTLAIIDGFIKRGLHISVAINISARQIVLPDFVTTLLERVNHHGIPPHMLMLELTETALVIDIELVKQTMQELAKYGFRFSIDDFGTGYSSLAYLKVLPISELKIDKYFIEDIGSEVHGKAVQIVDAIIEMAKALDVSCVAEGVETLAQLDYLKRKGCDKFQGYYFSHPKPESEWRMINEQTRLPESE